MIRKVEHIQNSFQKTEEYNPIKKDIRMHRVQRLITTYWFLFIPIYQTKKILSHNNKL